MWLRDLGLLAWFLVGVAVLLVGLVWLLGLTSTIIVPVIARRDPGHGRRAARDEAPAPPGPRAAGAAIVLLGLCARRRDRADGLRRDLEQSSEIKASPNQAVDKIEGWFNDAGASGHLVDGEQTSRTPDRDRARRSSRGSANGIKELTSLVFFLTFTASQRSSC